ncbi:MAG TPA: two-component regulator propeller domain-containing protein, partial [Flavobacteriales bacterium]|nr:two-component regulator propeller domain-containing protein [Flavobacteriales bacterium]
LIPAGQPEKYREPNDLLVATPGQGDYKKPIVSKAKDSSFIAKLPQSVQAKDAEDLDLNPANFSFYMVKEGLRVNNTRAILEDSKGNLWFGSYGGGVARYDGKFFTHYTDKEGLSNNYVWSILEDKKGNLWFATSKGVSKFDGRKFTHYNVKGGLCSNEVLGIAQDSKGNLWFATDGGGVSKFDGKNFTTYGEDQGLISNYVNSIKEDKKGNIWFATSAGLCRFDGKSFTHYTEERVLNSDYVMAIVEDKRGNLWFTSNGGGVCRYDGESFAHYTSEEGLADDYIIAATEDKEGNLWFGTYGSGVSKFDGKVFTNYGSEQGLSGTQVWAVMADNNGNVWFGTNGGVNKYDGGSFIHYTEEEGLTNKEVSSVRQDSEGRLWFGTNGGGVNVYDGSVFKHYTENEGLSDNFVWCIYEDKNKNMWFGTNGGACKFDGEMFTTYTEDNGLSGNEVWSIMEDSKGNMWFGTNSGACVFNGTGFTQYTTANGLCNDYVLSIVEDKKGNIWFGTDGGGACSFDGKKFTRYTERSGLSHIDIWSMATDSRGNIWFATEGGGVSKFDGQNFTQYAQKHGLCDNVVISILEDRQGNMWFGTQSGLSKLTPENAARLAKIEKNADLTEQVYFKNYTHPEGFLGINVRSNIIQDSEGYIWVGAGDRLTRYDANGDFKDKTPPKMQLTSLELYNEDVDWNDLGDGESVTLNNGVTLKGMHYKDIAKWYNIPVDVSLPYKNNFLTFNFIGISLRSPGQVKYKHILEGLDENWSTVSSATQVAYGNISPGTYTFKVKAMNREGLWSEPLSYTFTIRPPWWQTWWFRITALVSIIIGLYVLYRWRTASLLKRQKQLEQTVTERTAEVVHQKELVEERNKEITDSINYAKRIQYALLAHDELLQKNLPEHFVLFKPKDIVSGDFYWATFAKGIKNNGHDGQFYLAACDSTGHGVPGAFMSLLNISFLNEAINEKGISQPNEAFNHIRQRLIQNISQDGGKDGMDGILMCLDKDYRKITYAAAHNSPVIVRNKEIVELEGDAMPIGYSDKKVGFRHFEVDLQKGDVIFLATDGFADQFGGEKGKKYKNKNLNHFFAQHAHLPLGAVKEKLAVEFEQWRGDLEQVDDVLIIGIRV